MNRAKGGGWEFLDHVMKGRLGFTWNCASGCNNMDCAVRRKRVCYAERMVKRLGKFCPKCPSFKPHLHNGDDGTPKRFFGPSKRTIPSVITPVSMGDLFELETWMTNVILTLINLAPQHIYMTLTKSPQKAHVFNPLLKKVWFGVTVNEQTDTRRLHELERLETPVKWAIFEPLYSAIDQDLSWLNWIIIGPQNRPRLQPKREWVQSILDNAGDVPIFMKSALDWPFPKFREFLSS